MFEIMVQSLFYTCAMCSIAVSMATLQEKQVLFPLLYQKLC